MDDISKLFEQYDELIKEKNFREAFELIKPMADAGNNRAMALVGKSYHLGRGVNKNLNKAAELLAPASMFSAKWANEYFDVLWALDNQETYVKMIYVASRFAYKEDPGSMGRLGRMYRDGKGVTTDFSKATYWMRQAFATNPKWLKEFYDLLLMTNTPESRAEATELAKNMNFPKEEFTKISIDGSSYMYSKEALAYLTSDPSFAPNVVFNHVVNVLPRTNGNWVETICYYINDKAIQTLSPHFRSTFCSKERLFALVSDACLSGNCTRTERFLDYNNAEDIFNDCAFLLRILNQNYEDPYPEAIGTVLNLLLNYGKKENIIEIKDLQRFFRSINLVNPVLKKIQECYTNLLCLFDQLCVKYGIKFTISSGTLLGSYRHGGFIPWDDDVDILMMRPDFEKLRQCLDKDESPFQLISKPHSTRGHRVIISNQFRLRKSKIIAIGILLFDYVDDDTDDLWDKYQSMRSELGKMVDKEISISHEHNLDARKNTEIPALYTKYNSKMVSMYGNEKKDYIIIGFDSTNQNKRFVFKTSDVFPTKRVKFDDVFLPAPNNPEPILYALYSDPWSFPKDIYRHAHLPWSEETYRNMDKHSKRITQFLNEMK